MHCARATGWGLGLGLLLLGGSVVVAQEPHTTPLLLRLANLTTAPESARIGFAFDLEGPPLVDELPAGSLTTLLPGRREPGELWVLPRGQTLPKSLPEPLPLSSSGPRSAIQAPFSGIPAGVPAGSVTVFLIDRPGPRGDLVRQLVTGAQAQAESAQLRILNLVGAPELDVCGQGEGAVPVVRAVPAWGLSRFTSWPPSAVAGPSTGGGLTFRVATEPACRGPKLGAVQLRLAAHGAWTLVAMAAPTLSNQREGGPALPVLPALPALRAMLLDEGSFLPERAVALPVLPIPAGAEPR